ncbi:unnamed protein product [Echinostoma caproni]|uniref:Metallophos domain-containing protein n=1 Tax=Echinostoma caproni TaxID=27848 RepID=A0A183APN9_9TREM|nr:unnamed protein product [Echinostoma caproni]
MFRSRPKRYTRRMITVALSFVFLILFCEFFIYYILIIQCFWPTLNDHEAGRTKLKVMVLADPHLVGVYRGHPFDRIRRDWEMARAFHAAINIHAPDVVLILGDLFDEGLWSNDEEFDKQLTRYRRIFAYDRTKTVLKNVVGNHDIGFHYAIHPYLDWRFRKQLTASADSTAVSLWVYARIPFVLANSMAFEGDQCHLCTEAMKNVHDIGKRLRNVSVTYPAAHSSIIPTDRVPTFMAADSEKEQLDEYSRPILLLHFPLYRKDETDCSPDAWDAMPTKDRSKPYRPKWDCLSEEATNELLRQLRPRLVLSGHSHYSCVRHHRIPDEPNTLVPEWTVASFSWRNLPNPSFLMVCFPVYPTQPSFNQRG